MKCPKCKQDIDEKDIDILCIDEADITVICTKCADYCWEYSRN